MITQALRYFGIPRLSPARARVRAGRSPLAPWGGSDVLGLGSRHSTCQSSLSLNSDLAPLACLIPCICTRGRHCGFLQEFLGRSREACLMLEECRSAGGQAQATRRVARHACVPSQSDSIAQAQALAGEKSAASGVSVPDLSMGRPSTRAQSLGIRQGDPRASGRSNPFRPTTRTACVISPEVAVTVETVGVGSGGGCPSWAVNFSDCVVPIWTEASE